MKKHRIYTLIPVLTVALMGCQAVNFKDMQYFPNHSKDYLKTGIIAPLKVPAGMSHEHINTYPLPSHLPEAGTVEQPSLIPPGFGELT